MLSSSFDIAQRTSNESLQHRSTVIVQKMHFVDDDQPDEVGVGRVSRFAGDDIPLLGRGDNKLGVGNLLFCEVAIAGELGHGDAESLQACAEGAHLLGDQRLHGCNVHHLELVEVEGAVGVPVLGNLVENAEHGHVCLRDEGFVSTCHRQVRIKKHLLYLHRWVRR